MSFIAFNGQGGKTAFIDIAAGKDINATGSGIIGSNIKLKAGGDINGVIVNSVEHRRSVVVPWAGAVRLAHKRSFT